MRFVPRGAQPYLAGPSGPTTYAERGPAVQALLSAYRRPALLLWGILAWFGLAGASTLSLAGLWALVDGLIVFGPGSADPWLGLVMLAVGMAVGGVCGRLARDVVAADRAVSRAVEAWLLSGPGARPDVRNRALALASPLIPELFARNVLGALAALGTVFGLWALGYAGWQVAQESGTDLLLAGTMALIALAVTVLCAGAAVTLWRSTSRVQRGWVHVDERRGSA